MDTDHIITVMNKADMQVRLENGKIVAYLNKLDISKEIRTPEVTNQIYLIAREPEVRKYMLQLQRTLAEIGNIVAEGRDIGTAVFPDAKWKFFLTGNEDTRVQRRYEELRALGANNSLEDVLDELRARDASDIYRTIGPLKQAKDALLIDTTYMSVDQVVEKILKNIRGN